MPDTECPVIISYPPYNSRIPSMYLNIYMNIWFFPLGCENESNSVMSDVGTPWTVALQAPLSMRFSRQEYWSGLPFPELTYETKDKNFSFCLWIYLFLHFLKRALSKVNNSYSNIIQCLNFSNNPYSKLLQIFFQKLLQIFFQLTLKFQMIKYSIYT